MPSSLKPGPDFAKPFPQPASTTTKNGEDSAVQQDMRAVPASWGKPPQASESELYDKISREVQAFRPDRKGNNPKLDQLCEKYLEVQSIGPGDRREGSPYLGLKHLEDEKVFPKGSMERAPQFSKWANSPPEASFPFTRQDAQRLLHFLWLQPGWNDFNRAARAVAATPNAYYFALLDALESGHATHENLSTSAPGIYRCYRQSTLMPHLFIAGMLAVVLHGNAIRTFEVHCFRDNADPDKGGERVPSMFEVYEGWMVKKSRQILIHAFDCSTRAFHLTVISNVLSSPSNFPVATRPTKKTSKFQLMSGIATGVVGQLGFYSIPAVYIRLGDFAVPETSTHNAILSNETIVETVLQRLESSEISHRAYHEMGLVKDEALPEIVRVQLHTVQQQYTRQNFTAS